VVQEAKSWLKENQSLVFFLFAQTVALAAGGASILAYMVKLETRVSIMETRGAEYTVARMAELAQRTTVLEQNQTKVAAQLERIVDIMTRELKK
jgi:hypothetical protein